jgi:hypothetical protein
MQKVDFKRLLWKNIINLITSEFNGWDTWGKIEDNRATKNILKINTTAVETREYLKKMMTR